MIRRSFHHQKDTGTRKEDSFGTKKMIRFNEACQKKTLPRIIVGEREIISFDLYDVLFRAEQIIHNFEYEHFVSYVDFRRRKKKKAGIPVCCWLKRI